MRPTAVLAIALAAPTWSQTLLDRCVEFARVESRALLVPSSLADDLAAALALAPDLRLDRDSLDLALRSVGARATRVNARSLFVVPAGGELEADLLRLYAPLVEPDELEKRGDDLVWTLAPWTKSAEPAEIRPPSPPGLLRAVLGQHIVLGGPSRTLHALLSGTAEVAPATAVVREGTTQRRDGRALADAIVELACEDVMLIGDCGLDEPLDWAQLMVWSDLDLLPVLADLGLTTPLGEDGVVRITGHRTVENGSYRGLGQYTLGPEELFSLSPLPVATTFLELVIDPNELQRALAAIVRLDGRCGIAVAAKGGIVVATGTAPALRRWCEVLRRLAEER